MRRRYWGACAFMAALLLCMLYAACVCAAPPVEETAPPETELDAQVLALEAEGHAFIGNRRSQVLHIDTCDTLPAKKNRVAFASFARGLEAGYKPCGECLYWVNEDGSSAVEEEAELTYIGNKKSHKFHKSTCTSLPAEKNRVYFSSREDAEKGGFEPCGRCEP